MAPIGVIRVTGAADYSLALLRVQEPWALASPTGCILGHHAGALSTLSHPLAAPFLFFEQESWYFFGRSPTALSNPPRCGAVGAMLRPPRRLSFIRLPLFLFSSTPDYFVEVRAVMWTTLPFHHPFSLWSWALPDSLAAAFPSVTPPKVGGVV